jgi:Holliday junction resolvase RusA-like endonuclease
MNDRQELYFTAYGIPRPQGSKRHVGNGVMIEASDVKPWRKAIANAVFEAWLRSGDDRAFTGPVVVWATFFMPRPKSVKRFLPTVSPDLDKLQRALGDALSIDSKALTDDAIIVKWHSAKVYADSHEPGVIVAIKALNPQNNGLITNPKSGQNEFDFEDSDPLK